MASDSNAYPWYSPRFWHGMRADHLAAMLARHRFRISPTRWGMAFAISGFSVFNSFADALQRAIYARRVQAVKLDPPPLFIVGHWRSGTTLLHEYLVRDTRFTFPTTYQCFAPTHFLLTDRVLPKLFGFVLPAKRPMDEMAAGFDRPQEDEFALCVLGAPTPYERMAFPDDPPPHLEFLEMQGCDPQDLRRFEEAMLWFVKMVAFRSSGKRVVLKSPTHTGRLEILSRLFPGARFVHITRHPYDIFPSTRRLWRSLDQVQAFRLPHYDDAKLDDYIFECFDRMYRGFETQRKQLPAGSLVELRYEDLVADPIGAVRRLYEGLELGDFAPAELAIRAHVQSQEGYRKNRHALPGELAERIYQRWRPYFERYGYDPQLPGSAP